MTIRIKIANESNSPAALLIERGTDLKLAVRPGEETEITIWHGSPPLQVTELEDVTRKDIFWLTTGATT
jgi:hypothetical protein